MRLEPEERVIDVLGVGGPHGSKNGRISSTSGYNRCSPVDFSVLPRADPSLNWQLDI